MRASSTRKLGYAIATQPRDSFVLIKPFIAWMPPPALAERVAVPPYDVVDTREARRLAEGQPMSFFHVSRPDIDLPDRTPSDDPAMYRRAAENLRHFSEQGYLVEHPEPALYLYRLARKGQVQHGIAAVCDVDEYLRGVIRRHEKTRPPAENDRALHTAALQANAEPVLLFFQDQAEINAAIEQATRHQPLFDFTAFDGVHHTVWTLDDPAQWVALFEKVPAAYIADGHHRAAAAARVALDRRAAQQPGGPTGQESYNGFLGVLFPAGQLQVLPYHRVVRDLNGMEPDEFLNAVQDRFDVRPAVSGVPAGPGRIHLYVADAWHVLQWRPSSNADPVEALDVSVLHDRLLTPILGIGDPRNNPRIDFLGGRNGAERIKRRVDAGAAAAGFALHSVTPRQIMAIADAGRILPPKSTWFEPKLLSGLWVHRFGR